MSVPIIHIRSICTLAVVFALLNIILPRGVDSVSNCPLLRVVFAGLGSVGSRVVVRVSHVTNRTTRVRRPVGLSTP